MRWTNRQRPNLTQISIKRQTGTSFSLISNDSHFDSLPASSSNSRMMQRTPAPPTFAHNESSFSPNAFSGGANSQFPPSQHIQPQWQPTALFQTTYDQYNSNFRTLDTPFMDPSFMDVDSHAQFELPFQPHDNAESQTNLDTGAQIEMDVEDSADPVDSRLASILLSRYPSLRTDPTRLRNMVNNTKNSWEQQTATQSSNPAPTLGNTPLESGKIKPSSPSPVRQDSFPQHEIEPGNTKPESVQSPYSSPSSGLNIPLSFSDFLISDDDSPYRVSSPKLATRT
jgi:hypothetical protein